MSEMATICCPACQGVSMANVPDSFPLVVSICPLCGAVLGPREGDRCTFCSYGERPCPPSRAGHADSDDYRPPHLERWP